MTTDLQQRIATTLDPTIRTTEPAAGDIGHNRMFLQPGSIDEDNRTARFVCSSGEVDRYGEIVEPQAFARWLPVFMQNPVLLAGHAHIGPAGEPTTIGHWIDLEVTEQGLVGTAQFLADDPSGLADAYWYRYLNGAQKAVSVGFIVHRFEMRQIDQDGQRQLTRVFTEVELVEISAVAIPANRESLIRAASMPGQVTRGERLGERIRARREELELSLEEVIERMPGTAPISASTLGQIERGDIVRPPDEVLQAIAEALDLPFSELERLAEADEEGRDFGGISPALESRLAATIERILDKKLDASPGSHLCGLIMDVVQAHGSDGFGFEHDHVPDHGSTPARDADPEGEDNPLKHELREALACAEDTE